jgi:hypothetical protein
MTFLPLGEPNGEKKKPRKKIGILKSQLLAVGALAALITGTFATNVNVGTGNRIEFGQGSVQVVTCDTYINVTLGTKIDSSTGVTYIDQVTLSDLSVQLHDRTIDIELYGDDGTKLNSALSFSIASDGLTFTSTRSHTESIDAFTLGSGPKAERGVNRITFNNFAAGEPSKIAANRFSRVSLQTSGSGTCSVPSNIPAVAVYIDAPWVQGSYIAESFTSVSLTDNYNSIGATNVFCQNYQANLLVGTYSNNSACRIFTKNQNGASGYPFGGATTTSSTPKQGSPADQSPSAFVGESPSAGLTITFSSSKNYVGLWWSAGSIGNNLKFYKDGTPYTTVSGDNVYNKLPRNNTVTAIDSSTTYQNNNYYGHPMDQTKDPTEPFVFIHVFALNGFSFTSINLSTDPNRNGFEWDNLTVSNLRTADLSPKRSLVFVAQYTYN